MKQYEVNTDKAKIIQEFCKRYDFNYLVPMYYEASNNGDKGRKGTFIKWSDKSNLLNPFYDKMIYSAYALVTELNNLLILDIDKDKNGNLSALDSLKEINGFNQKDLDNTLCVQSASGGLHYYFASVPPKWKSSASQIAPNVDIRCKGGLITLPHSSFKDYHNGALYQPMNDAPVQSLPQWLIDKLEEIANKNNLTTSTEAIKQARAYTNTVTDNLTRKDMMKARRYLEKILDKFDKCARNSSLNNIAGSSFRMCPHYFSYEEITAKLQSIAIESGLPQSEIKTTIDSALKWATTQTPIILR